MFSGIWSGRRAGRLYRERAVMQVIYELVTKGQCRRCRRTIESLFATPPLHRQPVRKRPYWWDTPQSVTLRASSDVRGKHKAKRGVLFAPRWRPPSRL